MPTGTLSVHQIILQALVATFNTLSSSFFLFLLSNYFLARNREKNVFNFLLIFYLLVKSKLFCFFYLLRDSKGRCQTEEEIHWNILPVTLESQSSFQKSLLTWRGFSIEKPTYVN